MPVPRPRSTEGKQEFISRCTSSTTMTREFENTDQRYAVCSDSWENKNNGTKMNKLYFTRFNLSGQPQNKTVDGVEYRAFNVTMLVEGVHHGLVGGPTLYRNQLLESCAPSWEKIPITIQHPTNNDGALISANSTEADTQIVGFVSDIVFENGKLNAVAYINEEKAESYHPGIINTIGISGLEVSTGLYAQLNTDTGTFNGESYTEEVLSMVPDHLALLPDSTGACSRQDGCGLNVNEKADERLKRLQAKKEQMKTNSQSFGNIISQLSRWADSQDVYSENNRDNYVYNYIEEVYPDYFVQRISTNDGSKFQKRSYSVGTDQNVVINDDAVDVYKQVTYVEINANNKGKQSKQTENKMNGKDKCCPERVLALIQNESTPYTDEDTAWLESLTADQLTKIEANAAPAADGQTADSAPAAPEGKPEPNTLNEWLNTAPPAVRAVVNAGLKELDAKRAALIGAIMGNAANTFSNDQLIKMDNEQLEGIAALASAQAAPVQQDPPVLTNYAPQAGYLGNASDSKEEAYEMPTLGLGVKQ